MNTSSAASRLTPQQVESYWREGYLLYKQPVLASEKFAGLKNHFEHKLAALPPGERPENMDVPHLTDPELYQWLFADEILDLVETFLGPDLALFSSHFICKPKGNGKRVPWHEDRFYWKGMIEPMEVVTVWLAIDQSTDENGCMKVIPRSLNTHNLEYEPVDLAKNVFNTEVKRYQFDPSIAVSCVLEPNEASLHDGRLIHGSEPNLSNKRRCGYTMRYISARTRWNQEKFPWHRIFLARGRDYAGNTYGDPTRRYDDVLQQRAGRTGH